MSDLSFDRIPAGLLRKGDRFERIYDRSSLAMYVAIDVEQRLHYVIVRISSSNCVRIRNDEVVDRLRDDGSDQRTLQ